MIVKQYDQYFIYDIISCLEKYHIRFLNTKICISAQGLIPSNFLSLRFLSIVVKNPLLMLLR